MKINLETLISEGEITLKQDIKDFSFIEDDTLKKLKIDLQAEYVPEDLVIVEGLLVVELNKACEKCLKKYVCKLKIPFYSEYFLEDLVDKTTIDLTENIKEEFWLNLPLVYKCSEDCKGLCAGCGANLNIEKCKCKNKDIDDGNPFSILKKLKK